MYVLCFLVGGPANGKRREGEERRRNGRKVRREEQLLTPSYLMLVVSFCNYILCIK